jgi:predicted porin
MQYKCLAAALLSSLPLLASAQTSVTVYGVADAAVAIEDTGVPGESSRTVVNSGNQSTSRIGFRGTEDLGNGMKALFNIEAGVKLDTGEADSSMWGRRAVVGLQGNFGTVTVGREYTPIASVAGATDALGQGFYGSNLSAFASNRLTRRASNSVNYKSESLNGVTVGAAYSSGEKTVDPSGDLLGLSVEYKNGPFYLGAGYHQVERALTGDDKEYIVGAGYKFGDFQVKGNYMVADPTGSNNKFEQANVGGSYSMGAGEFFVNLQQNKLQNGAKGNAFTVAYSYALSKRTNVYTTYARMNNNGGANFALYSSGTNISPPASALGADPSAFVVGIRHKF